MSDFPLVAGCAAAGRLTTAVATARAAMRIICCSPFLRLGPATVVEYDPKNGRLMRQFLHFTYGIVSRREFRTTRRDDRSGGQSVWGPQPRATRGDYAQDVPIKRLLLRSGICTEIARCCEGCRGTASRIGSRRFSGGLLWRQARAAARYTRCPTSGFTGRPECPKRPSASRLTGAFHFSAIGAAERR